VASRCECVNEPLGSCAMELVGWLCVYVKVKKLFKTLTVTVEVQNVSLLLLNNSVLKRYESYYSCSSNGNVTVNILCRINK
jgi:hypothetical protein